MTAYETPTDALVHMGPGLEDFVTPDELDQLIDGTLAPAVIAARYFDEMGIADGMIDLATDEGESLADLLSFVRFETESAIEMRKQVARDDAMCAKLTEIAALVAAEKRAVDRTHQDKLTLAQQAFDRGATKAAVAYALGISRPTLDSWLKQAP